MDATAPEGWRTAAWHTTRSSARSSSSACSADFAVFLNLTSDWGITSELKRATDGWTAPLVVRSYRDDAKAHEKVRREAALLQGHGYEARLQRGGSDDLPLGAAATGERVVLPGTHNDGRILITYWRA